MKNGYLLTEPSRKIQLFDNEVLMFKHTATYICFIVLDYESAGRLCKEYASTRGPGSTARPGEHQFFRRLGPIITKRLDKATHENGFM